MVTSRTETASMARRQQTLPAQDLELSSRETQSHFELSCDACGTDVQLQQTHELPAPWADGWTQSHGENYCPLCSLVRQQTWGTTLTTE